MEITDTITTNKFPIAVVNKLTADMKAFKFTGA